MDWSRLTRSTPIGRTTYIVIMLYVIYTGYGYIRMNPVPNLNDAVSAVFRAPATQIDKSLKATSTVDDIKPKAEKKDGN
jgi:hypothetical protein